jgi:large subunit ribosomal protein L24
MTAPKFKVKKNDIVQVLTGKDKGRTGKILKLIPSEARIIVEGVNIVKRHTKPSMGNEGGIVTKESTIHVSNVALLDPTSGKPTRVGYKIENGTKTRVAKKSGAVIEQSK